VTSQHSDAMSLRDRIMKRISDPRKRRGVRYPFHALLLLALIGLMAREIDLQAIIDYATEHWSSIGPALGFHPWFGVPHPVTLSRNLARVPLAALQAVLTDWVVSLIRDLPVVGAVDGKYPHESRDEDGNPFGILSVFAHDLKLCLTQWVVSDREAEPTVLREHVHELFAAYPGLLAITGDAFFAQRPLCTALVEARRGYLLRIKGNQPNVAAALVECFAEAPQRPADAHSIDKRGGCVETRALWLDQETAVYIAQELSFVGAQQVARLDKTVQDTTTGKLTRETWYLVSYNPSGQLSPEQFLERVRGHWGIENSLHHVKDRSWGEDKHMLRRPGLGPCFAMLINAALTALNRPGWFDRDRSMPRRARLCAKDLDFALALVT
jgi:predicted transposase YbfD/YdcC